MGFLNLLSLETASDFPPVYFPLVSYWQLNFLKIRITLGISWSPLFHVHICQLSFQVYPEPCLPTHIVPVLINATTSQISVLAPDPHPCLLVVYLHQAARGILFETTSDPVTVQVLAVHSQEKLSCLPCLLIYFLALSFFYVYLEYVWL